MIVAPGLVDNHRHLWATPLRAFSADHAFNDYHSQVLFDISPHLTTDDVYIGYLLGAFEALNSGVTTVRNWNHGVNTPNHAFAAVTALRDSGIRNAAASLSLGDEIGRLAPGRKADIILINTTDPALAPAADAVLALLTAPASAIDTVLVDGHVVKRNGALNAGNLGWLRDAARQARNRLLSSV